MLSYSFLVSDVCGVAGVLISSLMLVLYLIKLGSMQGIVVPSSSMSRAPFGLQHILSTVLLFHGKIYDFKSNMPFISLVTNDYQSNMPFISLVTNDYH